MAIKKAPAAKATKAKTKKTQVAEEAKVETGLQIPVLDAAGKSAGKVTLPDTLFDVKVNKQLIAQAVRVHLANQRMGQASTKTRGEVEGSTRKIYRQKGTGRARHGGIRAPIFVGGGIVFGPKPRDYRKDLPQKMRRLALAGALTEKRKSDHIKVVSGLESLEPKTKYMAISMDTIVPLGSILLVIGKKDAQVARTAANLERVDIMPADNLSTYHVVVHKTVVFTKDAISNLK